MKLITKHIVRRAERVAKELQKPFSSPLLKFTGFCEGEGGATVAQLINLLGCPDLDKVTDATKAVEEVVTQAQPGPSSSPVAGMLRPRGHVGITASPIRTGASPSLRCDVQQCVLRGG